MADQYTPLGFQSYETSNFDALANYGAHDVLSTFHDSPYVEKLLTAGLSFDHKMALAKQANLYKLANLNGYRLGYILGADDPKAGIDPDSGLVQDALTNDVYSFRMKGASGNYDAVDNADVVAKSRNKLSYQPDYVAKLTGKRVEDLTEFDFKNVKNYQTQETFAKWQDPNHIDLPYNPNIEYNAPAGRQRIPVLYKSTGSGFYGRDLVDMINPETGRSMTFDAAMNPYLNASFKLSDYTNSEANRKRFDEFNALPAQPMKAKISSVQDVETALDERAERYYEQTNPAARLWDKLGYAKDMAKQSIVGEFVKFLNTDTFKNSPLSKNIDVKKWNLINERLEENLHTGSNLNSAAVHNFLQKESDKFYDNMKKEWDSGNYGKSAINALGFLRDYIDMMPEFIAQSVGQTGTSMLVGAAAGAAAGSVVPGAGTGVGAIIGAAIPVIAQGAYTATSNSADTLQKYKEKYHKDMPFDEMLGMFGEYFAAATYESLITRTVLGKIFGNTKLGQKMFGKPSKIVNNRSALGVSLMAGTAEVPQEGWESTIDAYYMQDRSKPMQSRTELITTPDVVKQAIGGGIAGFGISALGVGGADLINAKRNAALQKRVEEAQAKATENTITGNTANQELSQEISSKGSEILSDMPKKATADDKITAANEISELLKGNPDINKKTHNFLAKKMTELTTEAIDDYIAQGLSKEEIEAKLKKSMESVLASNIRHSHAVAGLNFAEDEVVTEDQAKIVQDKIRNTVKKLGMSEDFADQLIDEVETGIRNSNDTYFETLDDLNNSAKALKTEKLTVDRKKELSRTFDESANSLAREYERKIGILRSIVDAIPALSSEGANRYTHARYGKDFKLLIEASDIANNTLESGDSVYRITRNLIKDLRKISSTLNEYGKDINFSQKIIDAVQNNTNGINPKTIDQLETQFRNVSNNVKTKVRDEQTAFDTNMSKDRNKYVNLLFGKLDFLSRNTTTNKQKIGEATQAINSAISKDPTLVDDLRKAIDSFPRYKSEQAKANAHAALDRIVKLDESIKKDTETAKQNRATHLGDIDKVIAKFTPEAIKANEVDTKADDIDTVTEKFAYHADTFDALNKAISQFETISDNSTEDRERRKKLYEAKAESILQNRKASEHMKILNAQAKLRSSKVDEKDITQETNEYITNLKNKVSEKYLNNELVKLQQEAFDNQKDLKALSNTSKKWNAVVNRIKELGFKIPKMAEAIDKEVERIKAEKEKQEEEKNQKGKQEAKPAEKAEGKPETPTNTQTAEKGPESPSKAKEASGQENIREKPADASEGPSRAEKGHVEGKAQEQSQAKAKDKALRDFTEKYREGLRKAGMTDEQAEAVVALLEANARVMSKIFGLTPKEYLEKSLAGYKKIKFEDFENLSDKDYDELFTTSLYQFAYNGGPFKFDKFSTDFIGVGEGTQAHGWGMYFTSDKEMADAYRELTANGKNLQRFITLKGKHPRNLFVQAVLRYINLPKKFESVNEFREIFRKQLEKRFNSIYRDYRDIINHPDLYEEEKAYTDRIANEYWRTKHLYEMTRNEDWDIDLENYNKGPKYTGQVYKVNIPENDELLDKNLPLISQPKIVEDAINELLTEKECDEFYNDEDLIGIDIYKKLSEKLGSDKAASLALARHGVKGLKYNLGAEDSFIIFDADLISIVKTFYQKSKTNKDKAKGAFSLGTHSGKYNGKGIIQIFEDGDVSTALHETSHYFLEGFRRTLQKNIAPEWAKEAWSKLEKVYGFSGLLEKEEEWDEYDRVHERFARDFEAYMREGKAPKKELQTIFDKCKEWLTEIYKTIKELLGDKQLSPEIREVFDALLTEHPEETSTTPTSTEAKPSTNDLAQAISEIVPLNYTTKLINRIKNMNITSLQTMLKDMQATIDLYKQYTDAKGTLTQEQRDDLFNRQSVVDLIERIVGTKLGEVSDETVVSNQKTAPVPSTATEAAKAKKMAYENSLQGKLAARFKVDLKSQEEAKKKREELEKAKKEKGEEVLDEEFIESPTPNLSEQFLAKDRIINEMIVREKTSNTSRTAGELSPESQIKIGRPDCMGAFDMNVLYDPNLYGTADRVDTIHRMMKEMLFSPHLLKKTTSGDKLDGDGVSFITSRPYNSKTKSYDPSFMENCPHFIFLFDIDTRMGSHPRGNNARFMHWKANELAFAMVDYSVREFFGTSSLDQYFAIGRMPPFNVLADMWGQQADNLTPEQKARITDATRIAGMPRSLLVSTMGRLICSNLGLREKFETSNIDYYEKLVAGFGSFAVDYAAKLGLFTLTTFDPDEQFISSINNLALAYALSQEVTKNSDVFTFTQLASDLKTAIVEDDKESEARYNKLIDSLRKDLVQVEIDGKLVDKTNARIFDPSFRKKLAKYIKEGETGSPIGYKVDCVKIENFEQLTAIRNMKTEYLGDINPETGIRNDNGLKQLKTPGTDSSKEPHFDKPIQYDPNRTYVRNTGNKIKVSPYRVAVMQTLAEQPYEFDTESTNFLEDKVEEADLPETEKGKGHPYIGKMFWDSLGHVMGWEEQQAIEEYSSDDRLSAEGINSSVEESISGLRGLRDTQEAMKKQGTFKGYYYDYFQARNGRIHNASIVANQQSDKNARFMSLPRRVWRWFKPDDEQMVAQENYVIAQAFDRLKGGKESIKEFAEQMKSLPKDKLLKLRKWVAMYSADKFAEICSNEKNLGISIKIGIENKAQCFNVINHLIKRIDNKGQAFETNLVAENDSTTSGYANRELNMPVTQTVDRTDEDQQSTMFNKVGVFVDYDPQDESMWTATGTTAHESKEYLPLANGGKVVNLDMYKTVARVTVTQVANWVVDPVTNKFTEEGEKSLRDAFEKSIGKGFEKNASTISMNRAVDDLVDLFSTMQPALPQAVGKVIDKEIRTMMKYPTMIFIYSAGVDTMARNVTNEVKENFISTYFALKKFEGIARKKSLEEEPDLTSKEREDDVLNRMISMYTDKRNNDPVNMPFSKKEVAKFKAIYTSMEKIGKAFVPDYSKQDESFVEALSKRSTSDIYIKQGTRFVSLDTAFERLVGATYGIPAANYLKQIFAPYVSANDDFIHMTMAMYGLYKDTYAEEVADANKAAKEQGFRSMKSADLRKIERRLSGILPYITLPDNTKINGRDDSQIPMLKSTKKYDNTNHAQNYSIVNGQLVQGTSGYGDARVPASPGRSGAVLGIHGLDGHLISMLALKYAHEGLTVIHDAFVASAFVQDKLSNFYNTNLVATNLSYSLYGTVLENFNRCCDNWVKFKVEKELAKERSDSAYFPENWDTLTDEEKDKYFEVIRREELTQEYTDDLNKRIVIDSNNRRVIKPGTQTDLMNIYYLRDHCTKFNKEVIEPARDRLMQSRIRVANMDSSSEEGSALVNASIIADSQKAFKDMVDQWFYERDWVRGSSPMGYMPIGMAHVVYEKALRSAEARSEMVSYLRDVAIARGERTVSEEHHAYLKTMARMINVEGVQNILFDMADNGQFTAAQANLTEKRISLILGDKQRGAMLDPVTGLSVASLLAPEELYIHEMLHIANDFAFKHRSEFKINNLINKLLKNRDEAADIITWEDFMPEEGTYDESLKGEYEKAAKSFHSYIFDNTDHNSLRGLDEYCSFLGSNERLRKKLEDRYAKGVGKYKNLKLVDKMIAILKDIYSVIFGPKTFKEAYNNIYEIFKGNASIKRQTLLQDFDNLSKQLRTVQYKAKNKLLEHPMRWVESLFSIAGEAIHWGDEKLHKGLYNIFNHTDIKYGGVIPEVDLIKNWPLYMSKKDFAKRIYYTVKYFLTSGNMRRATRQVLSDVIGFHQQGILMSTIRDFTGPDQDTAQFESLGLRLRMVDKAAKGIEGTVHEDLVKAFGKELNELENNSLTHVLLYTDFQCLYDGTNLKTLRTYLRDNDAINKQIDKLYKSMINSYNGYQEVWIKNQVNNLASFLVYHVGNPGMNYNAKSIAKGIGYPGIFVEQKGHDKIIDQLVTLVALRNTNISYRHAVDSLNDRGLNKFLELHKNFVKESNEGIQLEEFEGGINILDPRMMLKGYTKQLTDPNLELAVAMPDLADSNSLANQGYQLIQKLNPNVVTNRSNVGVYTRFGLPLHTDGAVAALHGGYILGQSLRKLAWKMSDSYPSVVPDSNKLFTVYRNEGDKQYKVVNELMTKKELSFEDCSKLHEKYSGYIPLPRSSNAVMPSDYSITLPRSLKREHLGLDERGITLLSKMYGSVEKHARGKITNQVLIDFLRKQAANMDSSDHRDKYGNRYIKLEENTDNKYLKKMWKAVPQAFKDDVHANGDLWIREDWLQDLFGVQNYTLNNAKWIQHIPSHWLKRCIALAEMILKTVAYYRKQTIVIRIPGVLLGNLISNLAYSILNHKNPLKVFKYTLSNAQAIRDYIDTRKEHNRIVLKKRLGTATAEDLAKDNRLMDRLAHNKVAPLMNKGMYQAIVEDLNPDELESIGMVNKWFKRNKIAQKVPNAVKWGFKQTYMAEGTPIYDFLFTATQYSDFIARATEYQLCMEKVPTEYEEAKKNNELKYVKSKQRYETLEEFTKTREQQISVDITNAFINYDKPQSQAEQYLNDLGVIMFTKFAKRIQYVIGHQLYHKPISAILFLLSQHFLIDTEDILEQNMFSKHWSALVHSPLDNFLQSIVPMPIQFIFGDQKVF